MLSSEEDTSYYLQLARILGFAQQTLHGGYSKLESMIIPQFHRCLLRHGFAILGTARTIGQDEQELEFLSHDV